MAYKINKTDGSLLVEVIDSNIDQTATDLTLIGKNVSGYGEYMNENFIKLLENFASESQPNNPIAGQLWFDTAENRLKVYDGNGFRIGAGPIVSGAQPTSFVQGDTWIDSVENQLYFYDGQDLQLAGPIYKQTQGISGFTVDSIIDTNNITRTVVKLWVGSVLLGIFSKEVVSFVPLTSIVGYAGEIGPGFNQGTLAGQKYRVTATKADALVNSVGQLKTADNFMKTDENTGTTGTITIQNSLPLILGPTQNNEIRSDSSSLQVISNTSGQNFRLRTKNVSGTKDAITVNATSEYVGIFNATPAYTLDVTGNLRVTGNFLVEGSTTTVNSTNLVIEDHIIELAANSDSSVSDNYADQGGIVLKGTTDHKIIWNAANTSWTSTESIDLASGRDYKINGVTILSSTALGSTVTSAPGITSFGPQTSLTVDNVVINDHRIYTTGAFDLELEPDGAANVSLIGNPRITGLEDPVADQDAVNKRYLNDFVRTRNIAMSMDITGLSDTGIEDVLALIAPEPEYDLGTEIRIHCTSQTVTYPVVTFTSSVYPVTTGDFVKHYVAVDKAAGSENQPVLEDFDANAINLGNATIAVTRINKLFRLETDSTTTKWTFIANF